MKGKSVTCRKQVLDNPNSFPSCLIASMKGSDSISPTVPPISQRIKSSLLISDKIYSFIASVTWGITWIVAPK